MLLSFNKCSISAWTAPISVNRVNGIGENSNFSSQLRAELYCASPIPYHMFIGCDLLKHLSGKFSSCKFKEVICCEILNFTSNNQNHIL